MQTLPACRVNSGSPSTMLPVIYQPAEFNTDGIARRRGTGIGSFLDVAKCHVDCAAICNCDWICQVVVVTCVAVLQAVVGN